MQPEDYAILFEEPRAMNNSYTESKIVSNENRRKGRKEDPCILVPVPCIYLALPQSTQ